MMQEKTRELLQWYEQNRRILPWREDPSPYHVWLSEIMLQQTRVEAVKSYYERFLKEIPDVETLAAADEERLLKLWEGLGYYSRIRNMHKAAVIVMTQYAGRMPETAAELRKLPGIGSYTAGAIASIAYGRKEPAVDGNVLRVWARSEADPRDIAEEATKKAVHEEMYACLPEAAECGAYNQALMDLGAVVCIPHGVPLCSLCPWQKRCKAHLEGTETEYPVKKAGKARKTEPRTILILRDRKRIAIHRRPMRGLLAGMYEYPNLEGSLSEEEVRKWLLKAGVQAIRITPLPPAKHIFTHLEWHMTGYLVQVDELSEFQPETLDAILADTQQVEEKYPMPGAFRVYRDYVRNMSEQ